MAYQYVAFTPHGEKIQGRVEADSEPDAEEMLWKQNYTIVKLKEIRDGSSSLLSGGVRKRDLIVFSRQLATLIESGIPIMRALHLLQEQMNNKKLRSVLAEITIDIEQGRYFSEAILKHERIFPPLYGRLIEVGEQAGNLEMVLRQMAIYMEKEDALVRKVRGAMAYPSFVIVMAFGVIFLMLTVALPPLMGLFTSFGAELPLPTRILIALTDFFSAYRVPIVLGTVVSIVGAVLFFRSKTGRPVLDRALIKIPLIGRVTVEGAVARMCRSMSTLLQAGIALPEIMEMLIKTQGNVILKGVLDKVRMKLLEGQGLADPLADQPIFPRMLVQMARVGEETGSLDTNMETLAGFYEDEVDRAVGALASAMEPALTLIIGGIVGFVAIAVIMPMYSLMSAID